MADLSEHLIEHYQKTFELTHEYWLQRNKLFLYLVVAIGGSTILTYSPGATNSLLLIWVAKFIGTNGKVTIEELQQGFPFAILHGILLIVVFYLMVNLFHRALYVLKSYAYLGALEQEIRKSLNISEYPVAFTREGNFYWTKRPWLLGTVKYAYVFLLGGLLGIFLWGRLSADCKELSPKLFGIDLFISILIGVYFFGYTWYTLKTDSPNKSIEKKTKVKK